LLSQGERPFVLEGSAVPEVSEAAEGARIWRLAHPAAMSPRTLGAIFAVLGSTSLLVAAGFWLVGAPLVLPFAGLEVMALGLAFLAHARQMDPSEELRLEGGELVVRQVVRGEVMETCYPARATRLRCDSSTQGLIEVVGPGSLVRVGRHLPLALRQATCRSLSLALHAC
jgi:uncharacterized membrane protein